MTKVKVTPGHKLTAEEKLIFLEMMTAADMFLRSLTDSDASQCLGLAVELAICYLVVAACDDEDLNIVFDHVRKSVHWLRTTVIDNSETIH